MSQPEKEQEIVYPDADFEEMLERNAEEAWQRQQREKESAAKPEDA